MSSSTNQLSNISDGLSITLLKKSDTPIDITVSDDTASMQKAITDFVAAYSQLQSYISLETKYDPGTAVAPGTSRSDSPLTGDASVIGYQNQLRASRQHHVDDLDDVRAPVRPRHRGADRRHAGGRQPDQADLGAAAPRRIVQAVHDLRHDQRGHRHRRAFRRRCADNANTVGGSLYSRADGLRGELSRNQQQQDDMQTHLDATQARLTAQYQALDTTMSKMNALSSYVSQQISVLNK